MTKINQSDNGILTFRMWK